MIRARVLVDSRNSKGVRLTTFELYYPRFIHAEFMTHRLFSRNAGSSRAIRTDRMIAMVAENPAIPVYWGANQKGMQARQEVDDRDGALAWWLGARDAALTQHALGLKLGLHKQIVNRVLEPFQMITVIASSTDWDNWFWLRNHPDAQPEIQVLAKCMLKALLESTPASLQAGEMHLPLYRPLEDDQDVVSLARELDLPQSIIKARLSVARCARVSYLTHDGRRDLLEDLRLHDDLAQSHHYSPFEHVAHACDDKRAYANFHGFKQYRLGLQKRPPRWDSN